MAPPQLRGGFPAKEGLEVKYIGIIRLIKLKCPDENWHCQGRVWRGVSEPLSGEDRSATIPLGRFRRRRGPKTCAAIEVARFVQHQTATGGSERPAARNRPYPEAPFETHDEPSGPTLDGHYRSFDEFPFSSAGPRIIRQAEPNPVRDGWMTIEQENIYRVRIGIR